MTGHVLAYALTGIEPLSVGISLRCWFMIRVIFTAFAR